MFRIFYLHISISKLIGEILENLYYLHLIATKSKIIPNSMHATQEDSKFTFGVEENS